jgi:hypothetical protein
MSPQTLTRRAMLGATAAILSIGSPARAFDMLPDPKLHLPGKQLIKVGEGKAAIYWSVVDVNKASYGGEGKIVWAFVQNNPVPAKRAEAEAWYKSQLQGIVKGLGDEQPKKIFASLEMAGSSVVAEGPPFAANFNLIYDKREQVTGNIYALKVLQGRGRLIVLDISPGEQRALPAPAADFARLWGKRLKDMRPDESR